MYVGTVVVVHDIGKNEKYKTGEIIIVLTGIDSISVCIYENKCLALILYFHNFVCALS